MKKEFHIYAIVMEQELTFIGCMKRDVPSGRSAFVGALHEALTNGSKQDDAQSESGHAALAGINSRFVGAQREHAYVGAVLRAVPTYSGQRISPGKRGREPYGNETNFQGC